MPQTTDELILTRLDQILRVLAVSAVKGLKQREQIAVLSQAGLQPKDIAELLGTTSNTVRVALVALRKATKGRSRRATLPPEEER
jgi:DNA-binding CsgD family transcriptional regulator